MAGALSSLGLGSQGALSYDVIDKLKEADKAAVINPIDKKLEKLQTEKKDLSVITTLVAKLKTSASSLSDETLYLHRNTSVNGDSVSATASPGVAVQDINIDVKSLAKRDIYESKGFDSKSSTFTDKDDTLTLKIDSQEFNIEVNSSMTIEELVDKINDETDGKIKASILNTGGDNPYKIILKSAETGADNKIEIGDSDVANDLQFDQIEEAQDATFTYNGINITRSSNEVKDLIVGLTINLEKTGESVIKIEQDKDLISDTLKDFVKNYNELMSNLNETIKYDDKTKQAGTFQGNNTIISIKSEINRDLLSVIDGKTMTDFGLKLNEGGLLEFDKSKFDEKMNEDPQAVQEFFVGKTTKYPTTIAIQDKYETDDELELSGNDFVLNGKAITLPKGEVNLKNLAKAINDADIDGVRATYNDDTKRFEIIKSTGGDVIIDGDPTKLTKIGINTGVVSGKVDQTEGFFTKINNSLKNMISGEHSSLKMFEKSIDDQTKKLSKEREQSLKRLDTRYEIMATKFAAYDSLINQMNQQFQALQMQIQSEINSKQ
ncbi:MAG: flagellar filament capping protein FliD [Epsilonproteobacteria bacterium]|nr:flagellar filament capping protein FliD [Campylobacterota bacterium]